MSPCSNPNEHIHTPIDYTFLDLDYLLCTKNMFNFFKNRFNKIERFYQIGLLSTINVNHNNLDKLNIHLKKLNSKKVIAIFDNSVGPQRWYNESDYLNLISFIKEISLDKKYKIILKTKTNLELFKNRGFKIIFT